MSLPETITAGVTTGHVSHHEQLHAFFNAGHTFVDVVADGATVNTAAIEDAMDEADPGDTLWFPAGDIVTAPITVTKMLHLRGMGRFSTRFIPSTNTTSPLFTFDRTVDSGAGIYRNYGPSLAGLAIDRRSHMAGPCLHLKDTTAWMRLNDILCSGGTRGIEHHAPNATFEDVFIWDCSDAMIDMDENGLELHMRHVVMSANVQNLDTFIRVTISSGAAGGLLGALYIDDVTGNTAGVTVNNGLVMTAPSSTEVPTFCEKLILDNINGGGHVVTLTKIQTFSLVNSWLNGTSGCVKMDGCIDPIFTANRYRGGTHTYEFGTGAVTHGFQSIGNEVPTGPAYKPGATNKPVNIYTDDYIVGATDIGQVTTDAAWFETASRRTWGQRRFQGHLRRRELGTAPPSGFGFLVNGILTVSHPLVETNSRVRVSRMNTGATGLPGELHHNVVNNVVGTSFSITSTSLTDSGGVYWEFVGDGD